MPLIRVCEMLIGQIRLPGQKWPEIREFLESACQFLEFYLLLSVTKNSNATTQEAFIIRESVTEYRQKQGPQKGSLWSLSRC